MRHRSKVTCLLALAIACSDDTDTLPRTSDAAALSDARSGPATDAQSDPTDPTDAASARPDTGAQAPDVAFEDAAISDAGETADPMDSGFGVATDAGDPRDAGARPDFGFSIPDFGPRPDLSIPDFGPLPDVGRPDFGLPDVSFPDIGPLPDIGTAFCTDLAVCCGQLPAALQSNCQQIVNTGNQLACYSSLLAFQQGGLCP